MELLNSRWFMVKDHCIGCQACVDVCPKRALTFEYDNWGEGHAIVDSSLCSDCGLCDRICPALTCQKNRRQDKVYAAYSKKNSRMGSSGGIFYEMAKAFIADGGIVYGATFNDELKLIHKSADSLNELKPLLKSKYIHSDMTGVFSDIKRQLALGKRVMFVGTPCQVSAVKSLYKDKYGDALLLVDFLCHGAGTQKLFDACLRHEEKKCSGKITNFSFRSKSRYSEHSFTYTLKKGGRSKVISGYYFEYPYYNAYLKYTIFGDVCYSCRFATPERVGDITIADFWGIEKYNQSLDSKKGISMLILNSSDGMNAFKAVGEVCFTEEYPIQYGIDSNQSLRECVKKPAANEMYKKVLEEHGMDYLIETELACRNIRRELIHARCPNFLLKIYGKLRRRQY